MASTRKRNEDNCDVGKLWQLVFYVYEKAWWIPKQPSEVIFKIDATKE